MDYCKFLLTIDCNRNFCRVTLRFRNYKPKDENLRQYQLPRPAVSSIADEINEKLKNIAMEEPNYVSFIISFDHFEVNLIP